MKMKNAKKRRGFTLVELLVVIAIIAILAGLATPVLFDQLKRGHKIKATHNMKQLHIALFNFDDRRGSFPGNDTADRVANPDLLQGSGKGSANGYLSQLIADNFVKSEENFYAKSDAFKLEADNDIQTGKVLEAGECGMAYVMKSATEGFSTSGNPSVPLLLAPMAEEKGKYDTEAYGGLGIFLRADGAVKEADISKDGKTMRINGKDPLSSTDFKFLDSNAVVSHPDK